MTDKIRESKTTAEQKIAAAVREFNEATGLTPEYCLILGQEKNARGEINGLGEMSVQLKVVI